MGAKTPEFALVFGKLLGEKAWVWVGEQEVITEACEVTSVSEPEGFPLETIRWTNQVQAL